MTDAHNWRTELLSYTEMKRVREGFYKSEGTEEELSLDHSREFNIGLVVRLAGFEDLSDGLLYLGFLFPSGSELEEPWEPSSDEDVF